jgi:putative endonuclease
MDKQHVVYILRCKDGTLYTGYTNNLEQRMQKHEEGKGAKYTKGRGPFQLMYIEKFMTKNEALKREYEIKQLTRKGKLLPIQNWLKEVKRDENPEKL